MVDVSGRRFRFNGGVKKVVENSYEGIYSGAEGEKGLMGQVQWASVSTAHEEGTVEGMGQVKGRVGGNVTVGVPDWRYKISTVEFIR